MKSVVVLNPAAGSGAALRRWREASDTLHTVLGDAELRPTERVGHAGALVRAAIREGVDRIAVVGGDGTFGEAVSGFFDEAGVPLRNDVDLVVLPSGTGGDFARSVGMSGRPWSEALAHAEARAVDVGRATLTAQDGSTQAHVFINISSFGSSGVIVDKVNRTPKWFGGKASFLIGSVRGMLAYHNQRIRLRVDDTFEEEMLINTVAVANGRYFGGSMMIAPHARLSDGLFDVVVVGDLNTAEFIRHSGKIYAGTHLQLPQVRALRGRKVVATPLGKDDVLIDLDGEQPGRLPATYDILPGAIRLVAPWSSAEAA